MASKSQSRPGVVAVINLVLRPGLRVQAHYEYGVSLVLDEWTVDAPDGERTRKQRKFLFLKEGDFQALVSRGNFSLESQYGSKESGGRHLKLINAFYRRDGHLIIEVRGRNGQEGWSYDFDQASQQELEKAYKILRAWLDDLPKLPVEQAVEPLKADTETPTEDGPVPVNS